MALALALVSSGCSDGTSERDMPDVEDAQPVDAADVVSPPDITDAHDGDGGEIVGDAEDSSDVTDADEDMVNDVSDPPGASCTACETTSDCARGFCARLAGELVCLADCDPEDPDCSVGYGCVEIDADRALCVPDGGSCDDRCLGVDCQDGDFCDPATGNCREQLEQCERCTFNEQCAGDGARCLDFPDDSGSFCGSECSRNSDCDSGFECVEVLDEIAVRQCVPLDRDCSNPCLGKECGPGTYCEPSSGLCESISLICESCRSNAECGSTSRRCVGLPGPPCDGSGACAEEGEVCIDGTCEFRGCLSACGDGFDVCVGGTICTAIGGGERACVPTDLACIDRCADTSCGAGENCDPVTGECVSPTLSYCEPSCDRDVFCGDEADGCGVLDDQVAYCLPGCSLTQDPCPDGYSCEVREGGGSLCYPDSTDLCDACSGVVCDGDEVCSPRTGECEPSPTPCDSVNDCDSGQVCAIEAGRCVAEDVSCTPGSAGCPTGTACFGAEDEGGAICRIRCEDRFSCTANAAACVLFEGVDGAVCVTDGIAEATTCSVPRRASTSSPAACTTSAECEIGEICLRAAPGSERGLCSTMCESDDECIAGESCVDTWSGRFCVAATCDCLREQETPQGLPFLLDSGLEERGLSRCSLHRTHEELAELRVLTSAASSAWVPAIAGRAMVDPLGAIERLFADVSAMDESFVDTPDMNALDRASQAVLASLVQFRLPPRDPSGRTSASTNAVDGFYELVDTWQRGAADAISLEPLAALNDENQDVFRDFFVEMVNVVVTATEGLGVAFGQTSILSDGDLSAILARAPTTFTRATLDRFSTAFAPQYPLAAGELLIDSVRALTTELDRSDPALEALSIRVETTNGIILLGGTTDDIHIADEHVAFALDLGGDDVWVGPFGGLAGGNPRPMAVAVDLGGADRWTYSEAYAEAPSGDNLRGDSSWILDDAGMNEDGESASITLRHGAAIGGVAALFDLGEGADQFESLRASQGFGVLGLGLLVDSAGESLYSMQSNGLGASLLGIGIAVLSEDGTTARAARDAFGAAVGRGVGLCIGGTGDDNYELVAATTSRDANRSRRMFGAGSGIENLAGINGVAGGIGMFIEPAGADTYAPVRGAFGYGRYAGAGVFAEFAGLDSYQGFERGFGRAEELGIGLFVESGGAEQFGGPGEPTLYAFGSSTTGGTSAAFVGEGEHEYAFGAWSGGASSGGGFALFVDRLGSDTYQAVSAETLGYATPVAADGVLIPSFGIHLDGSGGDTWSGENVEADGIENNSFWNRCSDESFPGTVCLGGDRGREPLEWPLE